MAVTPEDLARLREEAATQEEIADIKRRILEMDREEQALLEEQIEGRTALQTTLKIELTRAHELATTLLKQRNHLKAIVDFESDSVIQREIRLQLAETENELALRDLATLRRKMKEGKAYDEEKLQQLIEQEKYLNLEKKGRGVIRGDLAATFGIQAKLEAKMFEWVAAINDGTAGALALKRAHMLVDAVVEESFSRLYENAKKLMVEFDEITSSFEKQMQLVPEYTAAIEGQYTALNEFGVSIAGAAEAQTDLIKTTTDYTLMSREQQAQLMTHSAVAAQLGVATSDYAQGVQNSMKMMGQSVDGAIESQGELAATARQLGLDQGEFAAKFAASGGALAKFGDQGVQAFKDLAHISKITGMELEKVLQLTNKFDTFEDAATMTGKLNAALGGNFVNAMDMMMTTDPAERFGMIRDSILDAGLSFDDMSYYQKQFYTESLGLSDVGDLAMMLSGNMDDLSDSTDQSAESLIEQKQRAQAVMTIQEKFQAVIADNSEALIQFADILSVVVGWFLESKVAVGLLLGAMIAYKALIITTTAVEAALAFATQAGTAATMAKTAVTAVSNNIQLVRYLLQQKILLSTIASTVATLSLGASIVIATGGLILMIPLLIGLALGLKKMWEHGGAAKGIVIALGIAVAAFLIQATGGLILLVPLIIGIVMGLKKVWNAFQEGATWAKVFVGVLAAMFWPITALIGGLKLLGMGLSALGDHWDTVVDGVVAGATFLFNMLTWPWRMAFETITNIWEFFFGKSLSPFMESIVTGIQAGVDIILKLLTAPFEMAMTLITAIMDPKKILALGLLLGGIILAAPFLPIAAVGLAAFAVGLGSLGLALAMIKTEDLQAIALFTSSMAEVEIEKMNALAESIVRIAEAIKEIPTSTALAMSATMTAASVVGPDIAAAVLGATGGGTGGGGGERPYNVTIQLELDGDVLAKTQKEFLGGRVRDALFGQ